MTLSACIVAHEERDMLPGCLDSIAWVDEIVVVVNEDTSDGTAEIALERTPHVHRRAFTDFSEQRNFALERCTGDWVLVIDADERIPPELRAEIQAAVRAPDAASAYWLPTLNIFLGRPMRHGGWAPDSHLRLFRRDRFRGYVRALHEVPQIDGPMGWLRHALVHLSHRDLVGMVSKTARYLQVEKRELPTRRVGVRDFLWAITREVGVRGVLRQGFRDGTVGWIEILYQAFSRFLSVAQAWESQHREEIESAYRKWNCDDRS